MDIETIPTLYARALLELGAKKGELERLRDETELVRELLARERDFRVFLESPRIGKEAKGRVIETALAGKVSPILIDFLLVVLDKGREGSLGEILARFGKLHDEHAGLLRAKLTTAVPLPPELAEAIHGRLERTYKKKVVLERHVDEEILGGFLIRFDGMVADASLKTALDEIGARMRAPQFGSDLIHEN